MVFGGLLVFINVIIDARGYRCPVPTLKLRKQMARTPAGDCVVLLADDAMAQIDVPHFCNQNKYLLISIEVENEVFKFTVRREI